MCFDKYSLSLCVNFSNSLFDAKYLIHKLSSYILSITPVTTAAYSGMLLIKNKKLYYISNFIPISN